MKLWDEELESYREEARGLLQYLPGVPDTDPSADLHSRAMAIRAGYESIEAPTSEMAEPSTIPGPTGDLPVRMFRPEGKTRALFLHIHGGGWVLGSPAMSDMTNEHLAKELGIAVLSVDYRLAPEHPYPAANDDCEAAARWLLEKGPAEFGADKMFIGGESAGGHLALVTGLRVRDRLAAAERLLGLNLVFGWYDVNGTPSQFGNGGHPDMLSPSGLRVMVDAFTPGMDDAARRDPDISPLYADLSGLPACLVSAGTYDHLCDDSLFLGPKLAAAGVDVELAIYPDSPHGYQSLPTKMAAASAARMDAWMERVMKEAGL